MTMTTETTQLVDTLKRQLKAQGLTYRHVAQALKLSEPSVKRLFASGRLTVSRLEQICRLLGFTLAEMTRESAAAVPRLQRLDAAQEARLVSDEKMLLVAVCALNHWRVDDIANTYCLSRAECLKYLLALDRMGLIALLPGDRIRVCVARDFDWIPGGPIRQYFLSHGLDDFLEHAFAADDDMLEFVQGMLTAQARVELRAELRRLKSRFAALHEESARAPRAQKHGTGLLLATREWEPRGFEELRKNGAAVR